MNHRLSRETSAILWLGFLEGWSQDTVSIVNVPRRCKMVDRVSSYEYVGLGVGSKPHSHAPRPLG